MVQYLEDKANHSQAFIFEDCESFFACMKEIDIFSSRKEGISDLGWEGKDLERLGVIMVMTENDKGDFYQPRIIGVDEDGGIVWQLVKLVDGPIGEGAVHWGLIEKEHVVEELFLHEPEILVDRRMDAYGRPVSYRVKDYVILEN